MKGRASRRACMWRSATLGSSHYAARRIMGSAHHELGTSSFPPCTQGGLGGVLRYVVLPIIPLSSNSPSALSAHPNRIGDGSVVAPVGQDL